MPETIKRHRWTKDELAHLNRTVSHSKNQTAAFKKIAAEMDMPWERVRSTYYNHHKTGSAPAAKTATKKPIRARQANPTAAKPFIDLSQLNVEELFQLREAISAEGMRRAQVLQSI